ncbi:MAG: Mfa1 family fimbria major subunit [Muribaculaceae bacterium]|nr:Mfa1 family fimbria major subunit [Muribaculaceae bacterium]
MTLKSHHILFVLSFIFFTNCSDSVETISDKYDSYTNEYYLNLRIDNFTSESRAEEDFDGGTDGERTVSSIAFYFFNQNGEPFIILSDSPASSNMIMLPAEYESVSGTLHYIHEISSVEYKSWTSGLPARVMAVANIPGENPVAQYSSLANKSLPDLSKELVALHKDNPAAGSFSMSSSTYADADGNIICWSGISPDNIVQTRADAMLHPVMINLERHVSKVKVTLDPAPGKGTGNTYEVKNISFIKSDGTNESRTLYAQILNWDLNATVSHSKLLKELPVDNPFSGWNNPGGCRSSWAVTPQVGDDVTPSLEKKFSWDKLSNNFNEPDFCFENTLQPTVDFTQDASTDATKVLLKARIIDGAGNSADIVSWGGLFYTATDFRTMVSRYVAGDNADASKVELRRVIKNKKHIASAYYNGSPVPEFSNIRYWDNGICYYVVNIRHTVDGDRTLYGVVRNHSYAISIKSISGLGTPGGGDEHDEPENPDPEMESFVSADVSVLPWHILNYNTDVEL